MKKNPINAIAQTAKKRLNHSGILMRWYIMIPLILRTYEYINIRVFNGPESRDITTLTSFRPSLQMPRRISFVIEIRPMIYASRMAKAKDNVSSRNFQ